MPLQAKKKFNMKAIIEQVMLCEPYVLAVLYGHAMNIINGSSTSVLHNDYANAAVSVHLMSNTKMSSAEAYAISEGVKTLDKEKFSSLRRIMRAQKIS